MSDEQRPPQVADAHPALLEMVESLLAEVPAAVVEVKTAPQPDISLDSSTLNNPTEAPLKQTRECIFYGLGDQALETPESRFSAIRFSVGRYRFVAPLNMLDGVARVDKRPTPMFGQPGWHRGLAVTRDQQITLVDLGRLLGLADAAPITEPDHMLIMPDGRHGILSSTPPEPVTISGSGIRWSRTNLRRLWMAALLPEEMCVLVDVEVFLDMVYADSGMQPPTGKTDDK